MYLQNRKGTNDNTEPNISAIITTCGVLMAVVGNLYVLLCSLYVEKLLAF
jgi:hypothetical protein